MLSFPVASEGGVSGAVFTTCRRFCYEMLSLGCSSVHPRRTSLFL